MCVKLKRSESIYKELSGECHEQNSINYTAYTKEVSSVSQKPVCDCGFQHQKPNIYGAANVSK